MGWAPPRSTGALARQNPVLARQLLEPLPAMRGLPPGLGDLTSRRPWPAPPCAGAESLGPRPPGSSLGPSPGRHPNGSRVSSRATSFNPVTGLHLRPRAPLGQDPGARL